MVGGQCGAGNQTRSLSARVSGAIARRALATAGIGAGREAHPVLGDGGRGKGSVADAPESGKRE